MSFTSDYSVDVPYDLKDCYEKFSNPQTFCTFMKYARITKEITISKVDAVYIDDELQVVQELDADSSSAIPEDDSQEKCTRIHFNLVELISHFGISKDIPVTGTIIFSHRQALHIDHRIASGGLVTTHNIRRFSTCTRRGALNATLTLDEPSPTVSARQQNGTKLESERVPAPDIAMTTISETLVGTVAWYLKLFTEGEARKSHLAFMNNYLAFMTGEPLESDAIA